MKPKVQCSLTTLAKELAHQSVFDLLPDSAFIRVAQLVTSPKHPEVAAPLPFSAPTLWRMVAAGDFPKPLKLSERVTVWQVGAVRAWMAEQVAQVYTPMDQPRKRIKLAAAQELATTTVDKNAPEASCATAAVARGSSAAIRKANRLLVKAS